MASPPARYLLLALVVLLCALNPESRIGSSAYVLLAVLAWWSIWEVVDAHE